MQDPAKARACLISQTACNISGVQNVGKYILSPSQEFEYCPSCLSCSADGVCVYTYLTLYKDVEEVLIGFVLVICYQALKYRLIVVFCQTEPWQITETGSLVIQTAAL